MNHFKVTVEDGAGGFDHYEKGVATSSPGDPFGEQVPVSLHPQDHWVVIGYEGGAVSRIPASRVLLITAM